MSMHTCISEIEEPSILDSHLTGHDKLPSNIYCVLIKNYLIVYKKPTDVISLLRLPLMSKTKLENANSDNRFSLIIGSFRFNFSCHSKDLLESWIQEIGIQIETQKILEHSTDFDNTEVKIDRFSNSNQNVYILINRGDYKLYVFESLDYHRCDIITHLINLRYYAIENSRNSLNYSRTGTTAFKLIGPCAKFKFTFKDDILASKWKTTLLSAINNSIVVKKMDVLADIYVNESNRFCADCGYPNPDWVSVNLCITICINCAGIHRSLNASFNCIQVATINQNDLDNNLIKLLQEIGNERSNSFWLQNKQDNYRKPVDDPNFIIDKYLAKVFMDKEFSTLSPEEIRNHLKESVSSADIFLTARLWFSMNVPCEERFGDVLLAIAKYANQALQVRFLSLQLNLSSRDHSNSTINQDAILQIALNYDDKFNHLFLVCLMNDSISIKLEIPFESQMEIIDICSIDLNDIILVWYDVIAKNLVVSMSTPAEFINYTDKSISDTICTDRISFSTESKWILKKFKNELIQSLLSDDFSTLIDDSNLFINLDVKLNDDDPIKCKYHLVDHEIIFNEPISTTFNLKKSTIQDPWDDDSGSLIVEFSIDQLELIIPKSDDLEIVRTCLKNGAKSIKLLPEHESIPIPIDKMIAFISFHGLLSEGIFRIGGTVKKIDSLYALIEQDECNFTIDPNIYHVNDVTSCLKKYFRSFDEPIITNELFDQFKQASLQNDDERKVQLYQQAVDLLPKSNYEIVRRILELFLMIQLAGKSNKMTCDSLALSTASSFISFETFNTQHSALIMKDLINNFQVLFKYSDKEHSIFNILLQRPMSMDSVKLIRTFHVNPLLKPLVKIQKFELESLNVLGKDSNFLMIHLNIDDCIIVKDVYDKLFNDANVEMWHFLTKVSKFTNKIMKRLIYINEPIQSAIVNPRILPEFNGFFVIRPNLVGTCLLDRRLFQCDVRVMSGKCRDCVVVMSFPNSLQVFEKKIKNDEPIYNFQMSDLTAYRHHSKHMSEIIILYGFDGVLKLKFASDDDTLEFLYYYDKFRSENIYIK